VQASPREYLTSHNLFNNELLVVTLSCTALSLAMSYYNFMEQTCNQEYKLININRVDRSFYRDMLLFISPDSCRNVHDQKVLSRTLKATQDISVSVRMTLTGLGIISSF
jgi:hypothetical protein